MATRTERGPRKIEWLEELEPAFAEAKRSGRLVLLDGWDPG
jgi:hypothetical protein